ncbi:MAG: hypothetical protein AAGE80_05645 [Pseudomonadota bacterium]
MEDRTPSTTNEMVQIHKAMVAIVDAHPHDWWNLTAKTALATAIRETGGIVNPYQVMSAFRDMVHHAGLVAVLSEQEAARERGLYWVKVTFDSKWEPAVWHPEDGWGLLSRDYDELEVWDEYFTEIGDPVEMPQAYQAWNEKSRFDG